MGDAEETVSMYFSLILLTKKKRHDEHREGGRFRKTIRKNKPKTEEQVVKKKDRLDKQLSEYWGEKPEVGIRFFERVSMKTP